MKNTSEKKSNTPLNDTIDEINTIINDMIDGASKQYRTFDEIVKTTDNITEQELTYPIEFLNSLTFNGFLNHYLHLKEGMLIISLRNMNPALEMCNGTRLIIIHLRNWIKEEKIMTGSNIGAKVLTLRIVLTITGHKWPFDLRRKQFPVKICYALTINKSHSQSLNYVGLYLPKLVFSHGQLYVCIIMSNFIKGIEDCYY